MATINLYIYFNGNAIEAFTFYKSVFGGEFETLVRFKEIASDEFPIPEHDAEKIMRIILAEPVDDVSFTGCIEPSSKLVVQDVNYRNFFVGMSPLSMYSTTLLSDPNVGN